MSDIHVKIYEMDGGSDYNEEIILKDQHDGIFKLDHPKADPKRIFIRQNGDSIQDLAYFALTHLRCRD